MEHTTIQNPGGNPYRIGDPVLDCAQGRPMLVLDAPAQTVAEWSENNDYDLTENYANGKFGASTEEYVVECVYVGDVRSEPSKTYTFPVSRVTLIDAHHADGGARIYERVARDVLAALFSELVAHQRGHRVEGLANAAINGGVPAEAVEVAQELADVEALDGGPEEVDADAE